MLANPRVKRLAGECGFELAGVALAQPLEDFALFEQWVTGDLAGEMRYLTDHRGGLRHDPRALLPSARSLISVGKLYNVPRPYSTRFSDTELAWISRYAWGEDYHDVLRRGLARLAAALREAAEAPFDWRICVDTAPLLERSYARQAGLGWIGKNTCLIHEGSGSWYFLGELLTSLEIEPDAPPPNRCGTCSACIGACPTQALRPYELDARRCISYLTIELRGPIPDEHRPAVGRHIFGCDICQDVCPWNQRAPVTADPAFAPRHFAPPLDKLASLSEDEFRKMFRSSPVWRSKHRGFLRNVAVAMGNQANESYREPLQRLAGHADPLVSGHARWALARLARIE